MENGLLNGYDGKINPTGLLTRAQMATMVNRAFGATATASLSGYEDVAPTDWYYEELAKAVQMGTFQGDNGALPAQSAHHPGAGLRRAGPGPLCWRRRTPTR